MTRDETVCTTPSNDPCWAGSWQRPLPREEFWVLAALSRTVRALPSLHPWRLADTKGTSRVLLWSGASAPDDGLASFTRTAREPALATGSFEEPDRPEVFDLLTAGATLATAAPDVHWIGGMTRLVGSWLPELAVLPRTSREVDDPGTRWSTESIDFAQRHTVHATDTRFASDFLAPHVIALFLDEVPDQAAVSVAGDAIHLWLPYTPQTQREPQLARRLVTAAARLRDAIPSFVTADHVDRSSRVEGDLAAKADAAEEYRRRRQRSRSADPDLQRIYDTAQAAWRSKDLSSGS